MRRWFGLLFLLGIAPLLACQQSQEADDDADGTTVIEEPGDADVDVDAPDTDVDVNVPDVDAPDVDVPDVDVDADVDVEAN